MPLCLIKLIIIYQTQLLITPNLKTHSLRQITPIQTKTLSFFRNRHPPQYIVAWQTKRTLRFVSRRVSDQLYICPIKVFCGLCQFDMWNNCPVSNHNNRLYFANINRMPTTCVGLTCLIINPLSLW